MITGRIGDVAAAKRAAEGFSLVQPAGLNIIRFKSWLPEYSSGQKPVVIAGVDHSSETSDEQRTPARALNVGPGEWLIVSRERETSTLRERIAADLAVFGLVLTDVSDELAAIELRGSLARHVLAIGCEHEGHREALHGGRCALTRIANVDVVVDCVEDAPRFDLYFRRGYYDYLYSWLKNAALN